MPTGFAAHWSRRAIVSIAAWLVVLQAFFAGVAIAQTGATLSFDPVAAAAICHGAGGDRQGQAPVLRLLHVGGARGAAARRAECPAAPANFAVGRVFGLHLGLRASGGARGPVAGTSSADMNA